MDRVHEFLERIKKSDLAQSHFLALLHILIGRPISLLDGTRIASGLSWRTVAQWLKKVRWNKEAVRDLGLDPKTLPPRDRLRYWFMAISQAGVNSPQAREAADQISESLRQLGYLVGPPPG